MESMETRTMRMNLQSMSKLGFILAFTLFFIFFIASVFIGALAGPDVIYSFPNRTIYHQDLEKPNVIPVVNLIKLNQQLILEVDVEYIQSNIQSGQFDVYFELSIEARKDNSSKWQILQSKKQNSRTLYCYASGRSNSPCESVWLAHLPFIGYSDYNFTISLINGTKNPSIGNMLVYIHVVNHQFTLFELWFRFTFLMLTFVVIILYSYKLRNFKWSDWTIEQKWVAVLLFGLLGYNNPFFPLEILVSGWFPVLLDQALLASFLFLLLLFWLVMFDGLWKEPSERTVLKFYAPKILLMGLFWIAALVAGTWTVLQQLNDAGSRIYEISGYLFFKVFSLLVLIVYVFWLMYSICRGMNSTRSIPYLGLRLKFFGIFTLIVITITAGGILFGFVGPVSNNTAEFLSFLSLFNLYIYTLAFVYLPSKSGVSGRRLDIGMIKLEEDEDENDRNMVKIDFSESREEYELEEFKNKGNDKFSVQDSPSPDDTKGIKLED